MAANTPLSQVGTVIQIQDQEGGLQLGRFVAAIRRNVLILVGIATVTASAAVLKAMTDTPVYRADLELLTPPTTLESQIISTLNDDALSSQSEVVDVAIDDTKLKILKSPRVMEPIIADIQQRYPEVTYRQVIRNLNISPDSTKNILTISYTSLDPEQVTYVLEIVSAAYLRYSLENRQNAIFRGIDFVDEQLPVARDRVEQLEEDLEQLRQRANLIDPLVQGEQLSQQAAQFSAEQLDLKVQIRQAQSIYQNLQAELAEGEEFAATSALAESGRYQTLLDQLLQLDSQLAEELTLYLEDSPEIEVLEERRANLQPLLEREGQRVQRQVENYILELQDRDRALAITIESLNQQIKGLSTTTREYNNIQRELDIATANLNQFLTKREALRIDAAQRQTPWEILTPPSEPRASVADARRNLLLGGVLGLMLGSGVAVLVDRISGKIYTLEELRQATRLPILGTIPHEKLLESGSSLATSLNQLSQLGFGTNLWGAASQQSHDKYAVNSPFFEAFRILSTNIQLSSPDQQIGSLAISSAIPNMGKSTITFHLAHAMAATGRKVLMVDTDLRRPTLHRLCSVSNDVGLSNYATGEFDLQDILINLPLEPNLFVLPSGPVPPDPIKILTAQRTVDLLEQLYREFDLVLFDTPPLLGFADAFVVSAKSQGVLLAAKLGEIKFSQLQSALDELSIAKIPVIGVVANDVRGESDSQYSYYQYYRDSSSEPQPANHYAREITTEDSKTVWYKRPLELLSKSLGNKR